MEEFMDIVEEEIPEEETSIVYAEGNNGFGQLGSDDPTDTEFILYQNRFSAPPEEVTAGNEFSVVRCSDLNVYTFGRNDRGQLGRQGPQADPQPRRVTQALHVKSGARHTIAIDLDPANNTFFILGFGDNSSRQLSDALPTNGFIPPNVIFREQNSTLVDATAGGDRTGILTNTQLIMRGEGQNEQRVPYIGGKKLAIGGRFAIVIGNQIEAFNPNNIAQRVVVVTPAGLNLAGSIISNLTIGIQNFAFTVTNAGFSASLIYNVSTRQWGQMPSAIDLSFNQDTLDLVDPQARIYSIDFNYTTNTFTQNQGLNPYPGPVRSIAMGTNHRLVLVD